MFKEKAKFLQSDKRNACKMDLLERTENENRHPWELSRTRCILDIIKKYNIETIADIGAGDRFFTSNLSPYIGTLYAIDVGYDEKNDMIGDICFLNDISKLPLLRGKCGLTLMDVLEHVEDDVAFLEKALSKCVGGRVFITVPAFQFLFSKYDAFLKHFRRYDRKQLLNLINSQNLHIEKCHYFYASLFLVKLLCLPFGKKKENTHSLGTWRFGEKHILTKIIYTILNFDFLMCSLLAKLHIYLPGSSLLAVCRKQECCG